MLGTHLAIDGESSAVPGFLKDRFAPARLYNTLALAYRTERGPTDSYIAIRQYALRFCERHIGRIRAIFDCDDNHPGTKPY